MLLYRTRRLCCYDRYVAGKRSRRDARTGFQTRPAGMSSGREEKNIIIIMIIMETRSTLTYRLQLHVRVHTLHARFIRLKCVIPRFMYMRTLPRYTTTSYPPGRVCTRTVVR